MYTIGEFAAFGRVSVRMLRHYDAIGLLTPARVDSSTGYRQYSNDQLQHLLRIVELRGLGIGLDRIAAVFDAGSTAGDESSALRTVLEERLGEIESSLAEDTARLERIRRRLRLLEGTETMSESVTYRPIEPVTVYAVRGIAPGMGPENVGPMVGPLIGRLDRALTAAGRPILEPSIFWYEEVEGSEGLAVNISYPAETEPVAGTGYDVVELPAIPLAATTLHRGDMSGIGDSWSALVDQVVADGYRMTGASREVYLEAKGHIPGPDWVTEIQVQVERI
ncbi:MerR family transcriptional regulator [Leifsonia sp. NPDC058292]|uniref:MerR family transcriptional regulator n=1 Tax=Leifsonia sp. NPDC058292 TaxID=3346428 RepID=UPI0036DF34F5